MQMQPENKMECIEIKMFGEFSIKIGDIVLTDDAGRAKQLWNLLKYLITYRGKDIPLENLIEVLWTDDGSDNPVNALKNLVYRLRTMLNSTFTNTNYDFIVFHRNVYSWNIDLPCIVDTDEFLNVWKKAKSPTATSVGKYENYSKAIDLYKGEFLPKSAMEDWVIINNTYYSRVFIECICGISELLSDEKKYTEAAAICEKAISTMPYEESLHELLIELYIKSGNQVKAVSYYEFVSNLFYERLGVDFSERISGIVKDIRKKTIGIETDLNIIKTDLKELDSINAPYYCDYEIFKHMYRIQSRMVERTGQSLLIGLITLNVTKKPSINPKSVADTMQFLKKVILSSLRKGDVVSKFSELQYVIMLPSLTFENGNTVLKRISSAYNKAYKTPYLTLSTKIKPIDPVRI